MKQILIIVVAFLATNVLASAPKKECVPTRFEGCSASAHIPNGYVKVKFAEPQGGDVAATVYAEISHAKLRPNFKKALEAALKKRNVPVKAILITRHR